MLYGGSARLSSNCRYAVATLSPARPFCLTNAAGGIALVCCQQGFEGHNPDYGKIQAQVFAVANAQPCNTETDAHPPARPAPGESLRPGCASGAFLCVLKVNLLVDRRAKGHPELDLRYRDIEKILLRQPGEMDRALIAGAGVDAPPCCAISTISSHFSLNSRRTAESPPHASSGYPRSFRPQRDLSAAHTWGNCREAQAAAHIPAFPYARSVSPA